MRNCLQNFKYERHKELTIKVKNHINFLLVARTIMLGVLKVHYITFLISNGAHNMLAQKFNILSILIES